ncbi:MAG TPA: DinB family protein [Bryobacteraceae bacterium]|nr:DinB family protein [Bryobacteraceae bacterium]
MRQLTNLLVSILLPVCAMVTLSAQPAETPSAAAAKVPGFRDLFLNQLKDVETKVVGLAEAMPQEKYAWRPGEGVRSVSEVYVHIAFANYYLPNFIGVKPPQGTSPGMEKTVTEKAKVVETLKASFAHMRKAVTDLPDADLDKPVKVFGQQSSYEGVLFLIANHMHEHLGQSIAYARTNGVVPPWSKKGGD